MNFFSSEPYQKSLESIQLVPCVQPGMRMLFIDPGLDDVTMHQKLGWELTVWTTSPGMLLYFKEHGVDVEGVFSMEEVLPQSPVFHTAVLSSAIAQSEFGVALINQLALQKKITNQVVLNVLNENYYQNLMDQVSLDQEFWPAQTPKVNGQVFTALQKMYAQSQWVISSVTDELDEHSQNPQISQCEVVHGLDTHIHTHTERPIMEMMTKAWFIVLKPKIQNHRQNFYLDIEKKLECGEIQNLGTLFIANEELYGQEARFKNCMGIFKFYENSLEDSWQYFEDAVAIEPENLDFYRNWMDVADAMGAAKQIRARFAEIAKSHPFLKQLIPDS